MARGTNLDGKRQSVWVLSESDPVSLELIQSLLDPRMTAYKRWPGVAYAASTPRLTGDQQARRRTMYGRSKSRTEIDYRG